MAAAAMLRCCSSRIRQNASDADPRYPIQSQRKFFFQTSIGDCRVSRPTAIAVSTELSAKYKTVSAISGATSGAIGATPAASGSTPAIRKKTHDPTYSDSASAEVLKAIWLGLL